MQLFARDASDTASAATGVAASFVDNKFSPAFTLTGRALADNVGFVFHNYERLTLFDGVSMVGVESASPTNYQSLFNGVIGIKPSASAAEEPYDMLK